MPDRGINTDPRFPWLEKEPTAWDKIFKVISKAVNSSPQEFYSDEGEKSGFPARGRKGEYDPRSRQTAISSMGENAWKGEDWQLQDPEQDWMGVEDYVMGNEMGPAFADLSVEELGELALALGRGGRWGHSGPQGEGEEMMKTAVGGEQDLLVAVINALIKKAEEGEYE